MSRLNELSKELLGRYIKKAASDVASKRADRRERGHTKAVDKLTKEDIDQLSGEELLELSTDTLRSYTNKSVQAAVKHRSAHNELGRDADGATGNKAAGLKGLANKHRELANRRHSGSVKALHRIMTKEELENMPKEELNRAVNKLTKEEVVAGLLGLLEAGAVAKPADFQDIFEGLVLDRIRENIDAVKAGMFAEAFGGEVVELPEDEDELDLGDLPEIDFDDLDLSDLDLGDLDLNDLDEEALEELSKEVLARYVKKASDRQFSHGQEHTRSTVSKYSLHASPAEKEGHARDARKNFDKGIKRSKSIGKAVDKLTKD